jgi:hypothetical protein
MVSHGLIPLLNQRDIPRDGPFQAFLVHLLTLEWPLLSGFAFLL